MQTPARGKGEKVQMTIKLLFFGSTAAICGRREIDLAINKSSTVGDVFENLTHDSPNLRSHKLLFAVNQEYVSGETVLNDGDELAVFTAVSGG